MAYGQQNSGNSNYGAQKSNYSKAASGGAASGEKKEFVKDPNEVGIAYSKTSEKGGNYFSVSITKDIPAGAKVMIFENKTKNRTEKTPTHVLKLAAARD